MSDLLVLLDTESIAVAASIARGLPGCRTRVFDPTLTDRARAGGLDVIDDGPWTAPTPHDELCRWAHAQASAVEARLQTALAAIDGAVDVTGWQHLNLYYLFRALRWYDELWAAQVGQLGAGTVHLVVCDNPAHYYWPSFVPALLLLQRLRAGGQAFRAFNAGARPDASTVVPALDGLGLQGGEILTHLPTCFYDRDHLSAELAASGRPVVNVQARQWDVLPAGARQLPLTLLSDALPALPQARRDRLAALRTCAERLLDEVLLPWLPTGAYRARQAAFTASLLHAQLATDALLDHHAGGQRPHRLLISEHDAGFHGPLLGWARRHGVPALVVPHSKTVGDIEFPAAGCTVFTHALQADAPVDAHGRQVAHVHLAFPETLRADTAVPPPLRTVGLLLNGLSLGGVVVTPYADYAQGIATIAAWCRAHGIALRVRSRPGQAMSDLLVRAAGLDEAAIVAESQATLADFGAGIDACLMFDAPTNAAAELLRVGVPVLNPVCDALSRAERLTCNEHVVPRADVAATLEQLDQFVADPLSLRRFRNRQFAGYAGLVAGAHALRQWL